MASAKQRNKALKRKQLVNPADLAPRVAEGLTQGVSIEEIRAEGRGKKNPSGLQAIQHMNSEVPSGVGRVPTPHFVAKDSITGYIRQSPDGRRFADAELTFTEDVMAAIRSGLICLKCLEPQGHPFEDFHLVGCEGVAVRGDRYMRDWQIIDIAMEFEGQTHLGPAKPLAEHDAEIEERRLRRQFDEKIAGGKSPMKGLR